MIFCDIQRLSLALGIGLLVGTIAHAQTPAEMDFFETKIRPVLVEQCYRCHSVQAKKVRGGLLLDSREALRKGGVSGPGVVAGQPEKSLILEAIRHDGLKMPPDKKLSPQVAADFERWIQSGAADPRAAPATTAKTIDTEHDDAARRHWAFQPIRKPALPAVKNNSWPRTSIDSFILAAQEAKGLSPSPLAEPRTLLRRVHADLVGLPPTADEVDSFAKECQSKGAQAALEKVVDRLLASPHYGERWARHWLDVARFADTKDGVLMFGDDRVRPFAYTYRDYVVRALNEDLPFDRVIHDQLAADQLYPPGKAGDVGPEAWRLAALGFLTLGRQFDGNLHDVIDDRIDVVTRGLLGLTVACARCHNHKYDPIPTADYYSLYGVFASCDQPLELPLIARPDATPEGLEFEKKAGPKRQELVSFFEGQYAMLSEQARKRAGDYLVHIATTKPDPLEQAIFFLSLAPNDLRPPLVARWRRHLEQHAQPGHPVFGPWHDLMKLDETELAKLAPEVIAKLVTIPVGTSEGQINPLVREAFGNSKISTRAEVARVYGQLLVRLYDESKKQPATKAIDAERQQLLDLVVGRNSPGDFPKSQTRRFMSRGETDGFGNKVTELDRMTTKAPAAPPRAMVLADSQTPFEPYVFQRGNPFQVGPSVPRQFLRVIEGEQRRPFHEGSGRLDLAKAITAPENPLTSRVLVNRVWMHHFGEPLVITPSDFGLRTSPPSHPELLDHLASTFMADGWSLKKLHRRIVLSATYQQASHDRADARATDPDNRLLWKTNRRRLDLEVMRDSLLAVSGRLDPKIGGRPVDIVGDPLNRRRTLYSLIDRQSLPGLFRAVDFAAPDSSVERRPQTTVPQQALFALNSPFMIEQAKALAAHGDIGREVTNEGKVRVLYRLALTREPTAKELAAAIQFLAASRDGPASVLTPLQQFAQIVFMTNEFAFTE